MNDLSSKPQGIFNEYRAVLDKIAAFSADVFSEYNDDMYCHRGCAQCCVDGLSVLPVEAAFIRDGLERLPKIAAEAPEGRHCAFLDDQGVCQIYDYRPLVCRTHGLPMTSPEGTVSGASSTLRVLNDDTVTCHLNFKSQQPPAKQFILDEETVQKLLYVVNARFCTRTQDASPMRRVTLRELATGKRNLPVDTQV